MVVEQEQEEINKKAVVMLAWESAVGTKCQLFNEDGEESSFLCLGHSSPISCQLPTDSEVNLAELASGHRWSRNLEQIVCLTEKNCWKEQLEKWIEADK